MNAPHFILTRFNLLYPGAALDTAWHEERHMLFEQFCLPSVKAQTAHSFHWLVFADSRTPDPFRARLAAYQESYANLTVCFILGPDPVAMVAAVRQRLPAGASHLITTTLDNDDAFGREFVARVQGQFREQDFELVNFLHGLRYNVKTRKLYALALETNPFISLIERIGPQRQFRSIVGCLPHSSIKGRFTQIKNIESPPLWLQVLHGRNAAPTATWGRKRAPLRQLPDLFGLDEKALPPVAEHETLFALQHARAAVERRLIDTLNDEQQRRLRAWLAGRR
ncbi:MAG: glycosyltransferase [Candidatus Promineifilaceae bacterium]